jgi:hypothetical protein
MSKKIKIVEANKIRLVDACGKTRILLDAIGPQNTVFINLFGISGESINLCLDNDLNPKITLTNQSGTTQIAIGISNDFGPGFALYNKNNELAAFLNVDPQSQQIRILNPKKKQKRGSKSLKKIKLV